MLNAEDIDVDLLEPLLQQLVQLIGLGLTMRLVEVYGGTLLYIPRKADENQALVDLIGRDAAAIIGRELGPQRLLIPKAGAALRECRNRRILAELRTDSVRVVARRHQLGERQVWNIKAGFGDVDDDRNLPLF